MDGYRWSSRLWRDAFRLELPADAEPDYERRRLTLQKAGQDCFGSKKMQSRWSRDHAYVSINPDLGGLFADNFEWIATRPG